VLTDLIQLRTFVTIAEERHLTRAAERLHVSQSAASTHLRSLEEALGSQLFMRTNRSLVLTRAGEVLLEKAKELLSLEAHFASFAREIRGKIEGNLSVTAASEPGTRIGQMVKAVRSRHPLVTIDMSTRPSFGARQAMKSGELDVGVFCGEPGDTVFTFHELTKVQFRVAGPAEWKEEILNADWAKLARLPWLLPSASSAYTTMLTEMFGLRDLQLNGVLRFETAMMGRAALDAGVGVMLLREEAALQGEKDGLLTVSPLARAEFALSIVHLSSRIEDPLINAFVQAGKVVWPQSPLATNAT